MIKNMSCSFLTKFIIVMPCDLGHQGLDWALVYVPEVTPNHIRRSLALTTETALNCFHRKER